MTLHMSCVGGIHHSVPLLFDYYHFAAVDNTIHGILTAVGLPDLRFGLISNNKALYGYGNSWEAGLSIKFEVGEDILKVDGTFYFIYFFFKKGFCNDRQFRV